MGFSFRHRDRSVAAGVRRMAERQLDRAIADILDENIETGLKIHRSRRRCKAVRGLIRLVGPAFPDYARENAVLRDTSRDLSPLRDADVLIATASVLFERHGEGIDLDLAEATRRYLERRREELLRGGPTPPARLARAAEALARARARCRRWKLRADGAEAFAEGLRKTYAGARKAMGRAAKTGEEDAFHEWRKQVKYHTMHLGILRRAALTSGPERRADLDGLGEILGEAHDASVLSAVLAEALAIAAIGNVGPVLERAEERRVALEALALETGRHLFDEKPARLTRGIVAGWNRWRIPPRSQVA